MRLLLWLGLLIGLLGDPSFRVREKAQAQLQDQLELSIGLVKLGERHHDAEIAGRCRSMVNDWTKLHADELTDALLPDGWRQFPWLHNWAFEYESEPWYAAREYLAKAGDQGWPANPHKSWNYRSVASWLWLRDLVAARQPTAWLLIVLTEHHREQCKTYHWPVPPRWKPPAPGGSHAK